MNTAGKKNKRISRITKFESDFLKIKEEIRKEVGWLRLETAWLPTPPII